MTKSPAILEETVRQSKRPFGKADHYSKKSGKHRYERRKIKEYLHLGDSRIEDAM